MKITVSNKGSFLLKKERHSLSTPIYFDFKLKQRPIIISEKPCLSEAFLCAVVLLSVLLCKNLCYEVNSMCMDWK